MPDSVDIFVSWSGPRSKALALYLHEWLKTVVQRANPWMSERDIDAGDRWNDQISARLKDTNFGIICLTPENLDAPWLLFEAGALAKALDVARVVPVLLDVRKADLTFPLAQFQAVEANREGLFALVSAVNRFLGAQQLPASLLVNIFGGLWGPFDAALQTLPPAAPGSGRPYRSERDVLDDILEGVRSLQHKIGSEPVSAVTVDSGDWEDYYIRGVNLANTRGGRQTDVGALRAYNEAITLAHPDLPDNTRSRLHAYRGAILKRLGRLEEAQQDLSLARRWARDDREINDALYNLACVAALEGSRPDALSLLRELISRDAQWSRVVAEKVYFASLRHDPEFKELTRVDR
jgi:tetratricopeptide (TPR) repeat protein